MQTTIEQLTVADLDAVDDLMKRYGRTLGFLPKGALEYYLKGEKGAVLGAKANTGQLVGYLLYAANPNYFRITHLCVMEEYRGQGIAKQLVNDLKESADTQKVIKLNCRRDFPANDFWPKLGFVAVGEKPSRSKARRLLTTWQLTLSLDDQLELFQIKTSDEILDIILDAQIFFDFDEPDSDKTMPSKVLLSDFLIDSLDIWITDELLNEINRQDNSETRRKSRNRSQRFPQVKPEPYLVEKFDKHLRKILPSCSESQESDIRQLAKAAASPVQTFVTRDRGLLKKSKDIADLTGLEMVSPIELIIQHHEFSARQSYAPDRIAGLNLRWNRLTSNDLTDFPFEPFLKRQETKGKFRVKLESLIAQPYYSECELLRSGDDIIALRVIKNGFNKILTVPLARVKYCANQSPTDRALFGRFLIADTVSKAVEKNLDMVKFEIPFLTPSLVPYLLEMGFVECNNSLVRFCFSRCLSRTEVLSEISELCPESTSEYQDMSDIELEQRCSPLVLDSTDQNCFLVPIIPVYAMGLIDKYQSAEDLFGGDPNVLLRWNNVYYRKASHHKMLKAPGRILWYASRSKKQIVAISCLDEVIVDSTRELFRTFKKFGVLKWEDLYEMCGRDPSKELMALKFSNTFLFRKPVSLDDIRIIYTKYGAGLSLQGPSKIPSEISCELFQKGF